MQLYNGMRNNNSCSKAKTRIGHRGKKKKKETKESEQARDIVVVMTGVKKGGLIKRVRPARGVGEYNTII
jgi:hypothetical protein